MKLSQDELAARLKSAKVRVEVGAKYRHYKSPDMTYLVKDIVIQESDNKPCVIYQALYGNQLTFCRPVTVWLEEVVVNGEQLSRFTKLS